MVFITCCLGNSLQGRHSLSYLTEEKTDSDLQFTSSYPAVQTKSYQILKVLLFIYLFFGYTTTCLQVLVTKLGMGLGSSLKQNRKLKSSRWQGLPSALRLFKKNSLSQTILVQAYLAYNQTREPNKKAVS